MSGPGRSRSAGLLVLWTGMALGACGGPEAPTGSAPAPVRAAPPPGPARAAVLEDPEATALAAAVVVPGSAWELPGTEGLTLLSALTLLEEAAPGLEALGADATVKCGPATFTFTLVAPRSASATALELFLDGLFRPAPTVAALERARARLAASLALDQASPAWQARLAVRRALHDDTLSSGWLGPACGVPETLGFFDLAAVRAGAHRFAPRLAHAAVITPSGAAGMEARLRDRLPGPAPAIPAPRTTRAGRVYVERNTVTAWLAVAFPFGPDADLEAVRLLGAVLADAISPGVDRPDSFTSGHELELHGAGGVLVVRAVTAPGAAEAYGDRIEAAVADIAIRGVPDAVYERVARRHRGRRLLESEAPEARAGAVALDLALGRAPVEWPDPDVGAARLRRAAGALGPAARAVVGPRSARGAAEP